MANIQVDSVAELEKVMMEETYKIMSKTSNKLIGEIKDSIKTVVNDSYSPKQYQRKHYLEKTLRHNNTDKRDGVNNYTATIIIDHDREKADWKSVKDGKQYKYVPETVSEGRYGHYCRNGHHIVPSATYSQQWSRPRDYMRNAEEKLDNNEYLRRCFSTKMPDYIKII